MFYVLWSLRDRHAKHRMQGKAIQSGFRNITRESPLIVSGPQDGQVKYSVKRMMPTVGCEADAVAFTEEKATVAGADAVFAFLPDGCYSMGAARAGLLTRLQRSSVPISFSYYEICHRGRPDSLQLVQGKACLALPSAKSIA